MNIIYFSLLIILSINNSLGLVNNYSTKKSNLMMKSYLGGGPIFVAGGSSGVGLEVVKQLSAIGTPVRALVRRPEAKAALEKLNGVTAFLGDAKDPQAVQSAMENCVAAVTTLGGKKEGEERIDYVGNSNVIEQAGILGCERVILVTSIGCGDSKEAVSPQVREQFVNYNSNRTLIFPPSPLFFPFFSFFFFVLFFFPYVSYT